MLCRHQSLDAAPAAAVGAAVVAAAASDLESLVAGLGGAVVALAVASAAVALVEPVELAANQAFAFQMP